MNSEKKLYVVSKLFKFKRIKKIFVYIQKKNYRSKFNNSIIY